MHKFQEDKPVGHSGGGVQQGLGRSGYLKTQILEAFTSRWWLQSKWMKNEKKCALRTNPGIIPSFKG